MNHWSKRLIYWRDDERYFNVSVPFTWLLPDAKKLCQQAQDAGFRVNAGGPGVDLMPDYLADVAECGGQMTPLPLSRHNPDATFTTRGCIRRCEFCAVPRIEGELRELPDWIPAPIVCDNNLLAASRAHFDRVIDSLKPFKAVDFNQGLDCRLLNDHHLERLAELRVPQIRFSWDHIAEESAVVGAIAKAMAAGVNKRRITVYVLIGHRDTPDDALYRLDTLRDMGVNTFPMRFQSLVALKKDDYVATGWTADELRRMMRYWCNRKVWKVPYSEFVG